MPGPSPGMTSVFHRSRDENQNRRLRPLVPEQPQPLLIQPLLLAVADAVDRTGPVVGDEQRAVLGQHDIGRTAEIALVALDPAGREDLLLGVNAVGTDVE